MNVSAVIVTRGNVALGPVLDSLPAEWERIVWDNGSGRVIRSTGTSLTRAVLARDLPDLAVWGRYAGINYAAGDVIYVQDDDVIVSDPQAIVDGLITNYAEVIGAPLQIAKGIPTHVSFAKNRIVCNMPQEFRHDGYVEHALVGFGAAFHRDVPTMALGRMVGADFVSEGPDLSRFDEIVGNLPWFHRTCDIPVTFFTERVLVDVSRRNLDYAYGDDRMYRQPEHVGERARMLDLCRQQARW